MAGVTESVVEQAALAWFESTGGSVKTGPEIAPGELAAERALRIRRTNVRGFLGEQPCH
jgi:hypothetical protein